MVINRHFEPSDVRKNFGIVLIVFSLFLTTVVWWGTRKETQRLALRQDLVYEMLESDRYPLAILDEKGNVVQWNVGMEHLTGVSAEEAKIRGIQAVCPIEMFEKHCKGFFKRMEDFKNGSLTIVTCEIKNRKTGRTIPIRIAVRAIEANGNKYALARIDRISQITELGKPPDQAKVQADKVN